MTADTMGSSGDPVVIVGGGLAALRSAEELRKRGYDGGVVMISDEQHLPYDRPPLSKQVLVGDREAHATVYKEPAHFEELDVDVRLGSRATGLASDRQVVQTTAGDVAFSSLVIATGASARRLPFGEDLQGVHTLRTIDDAVAVRSAIAAGGRLVVVGAGPIGAEVASSARSCGADVTVVEALDVPMVRAVGREMGEICAGLHGDGGSQLICGVGVAGLAGSDRVQGVELADGRVIPADVVVVGIGAVPEVSWLAGSGVELANGVVCDERLRTTRPDVYAAGDIASFPNQLLAGARMRSEQWTNAIEQGRYVARQIVDGAEATEPFGTSNYFWSDQFGMRLQFVGTADSEEVVVVSGDTDGRKFLAYYRRGDQLVGAFSLNMPKLLMQSKLLIERGASWAEARDLVPAAA